MHCISVTNATKCLVFARATKPAYCQRFCENLIFAVNSFSVRQRDHDSDDAIKYLIKLLQLFYVLWFRREKIEEY